MIVRDTGLLSPNESMNRVVKDLTKLLDVLKNIDFEMYNNKIVEFRGNIYYSYALISGLFPWSTTLDLLRDRYDNINDDLKLYHQGVLRPFSFPDSIGISIFRLSEVKIIGDI